MSHIAPPPIQLDAVEMVRRSERALGVAIRKGQDAGEIGSRTNQPYFGNQHSALPHVERKTSPESFFSGGKDQSETYAMTDGVSDDEFDAALAEAKDEGNLSRANVVRRFELHAHDVARACVAPGRLVFPRI